MNKPFRRAPEHDNDQPKLIFSISMKSSENQVIYMEPITLTKNGEPSSIVVLATFKKNDNKIEIYPELVTDNYPTNFNYHIEITKWNDNQRKLMLRLYVPAKPKPKKVKTQLSSLETGDQFTVHLSIENYNHDKGTNALAFPLGCTNRII